MSVDPHDPLCPRADHPWDGVQCQCPLIEKVTERERERLESIIESEYEDWKSRRGY